MKNVCHQNLYTDQYSAKQLQEMDHEKFLIVGPYEKRSCGECGYLYPVITWWCGSKRAYEYRRTKIPGGIKCPFWIPDWKEIDECYYFMHFFYKIIAKIKLKIYKNK